MSDNLPAGQPYRETFYGVGVTGSDVVVASRPFAASWLLAAHSLIVLDADSGATRVEVSVGPYGAAQPVAVSGALSAGVGLLIDTDFYVSDAQRMLFTFIGTTTGDALSVTVEGSVRYTGGPAVPVAVGQ